MTANQPGAPQHSSVHLYLLIGFFCLIKLSLHLVADYHSGFQGDELLHIETGHHLSFGYMEYPPMIGWLAFLQNLFQSNSVFVQHIFSHLASILIMLFAGLACFELKPKLSAVFLVLLFILVAPAFGRSQQLFQPVVFSQLCWVLSFYQLVRFIKTLDRKFLLYLSITLAFGFLTKYDIIFFIAGLPPLLFFAATRNALLHRSTIAYVLIFFLLITPNILWQWQHGFPVFQHIDELYRSQLDKLKGSRIITDLILGLNPLVIFSWIAAVLFLLRKNRPVYYFPLVLTILLSIFFLAVSKAKAYYFFPAMLTLTIAGCAAIDTWLSEKRKWAIYPITALLLASGIFLIPFGMPVLPLQNYIRFTQLKKKDGRYPVDFQEFYSKELWDTTLRAIKAVYDSLPPEQQKNCLIWGKHYRQAGIVNLLHDRYGLPPAFSYHGSFYLWAPAGEMPATIIGFSTSDAAIDFWTPFFNEVIPVRQVYDKYAKDTDEAIQTIYVCKHPRQDFTALKKMFSNRIFE